MHTQLTSIIVRAMKQPSFREELIANPHKILEQENIVLPESCHVTILEQSLKKVYVVLPHATLVDKLAHEKGKLNPLESIIVRAVKDPAYKQQLIQHTKKILEEECDIELPLECVGEVIQESPESLFIVIPYVPHPEKLSDKELTELASGVRRLRHYGNIENFNTLGSLDHFASSMIKHFKKTGK